MSARLKKKTLTAIGAGLLSLLVLGAFLLFLQTKLSLSSQRQNILQKLEQVDELLLQGEQDEEKTTASYDQIYLDKATTLAYMVSERIDPTVSNAVLRNYNRVINATNLLIVSREGEVLASAAETPADFTRARYNELRDAFSGSGTAEPFDVTGSDGRMFRYYAARIDGTRLAVVEQDPAELNKLIEDTATLPSILSTVSAGKNGFAFAVSNRDYTFLSYPDETKLGEDALDAGIEAAALESGSCSWMSVFGERYYCGVTATDDAYVICAVPEAEIYSSRNLVVGMILAVFFIVVTIVIAYAVLIAREEENDPEAAAEGRWKKIGSLSWNRTIGRKTVTVSLIGLCAVFLVSLYMQTLFSMTSQAVSSRQRINDVSETIERYQSDIELLTSRFNRSYRAKAETAAFILDKKPELVNRKKAGAAQHGPRRGVHRCL